MSSVQFLDPDIFSKHSNSFLHDRGRCNYIPACSYEKHWKVKLRINIRQFLIFFVEIAYVCVEPFQCWAVLVFENIAMGFSLLYDVPC
jgi:hypothetical protein